MPLFSDEERAEVGTLYKRTGREASILRGLEIAGPKLAGFAVEGRRAARANKVLVYCWRGGMRSANMGWLLEMAGLQVAVLEGGYKAYRNFIRGRLAGFANLAVLGGKTGSGKTEILDHMQENGEQVVDLEGLANHKGSAFGDLGQERQPSSEQFENDLYAVIATLDPAEVTFVEDESRGIGRVSIPDVFYQTMRGAPVVFLDVPKEERIRRLVREYASFPPERLAAAINRITRKLGGLNCKLALEALHKGNHATVADILLTYYDKAYLKGLSHRDPRRVWTVPVEKDAPEDNAQTAIAQYKKMTAADKSNGHRIQQ
jgi:tRNA 2-selenouridine synthase